MTQVEDTSRDSMLATLLVLLVPAMRCDEVRRVEPRSVKAALTSLRRDMADRGLHITDLPSEGIAARRLLEAQMKTGAWCGANDQLRLVRDAVTRTAVDEPLVSAKIARAASLANGLSGKRKNGARQHLTAAERELAARHLPKANRHANEALYLGLGARDPWVLPKSTASTAVPSPVPAPSAPVNAPASTEELPEKEVQGGCPALAEGHAMTIAAALDRLADTLEQTQVRTIDVRRGPNLVELLDAAVRAHDDAKAVRAICVLTHRATLVVDDLDRAMARFQRVNVLRDKRGVSAVEKPQFDALVNEAASRVAVRDYRGARTTLETLLVFLGDPARPSGNLPRL